MRIYEGSPRQDFEEVFRSIGAFLDQRGMKDVLLVEAPDGFIVQGLVTSGGGGGYAGGGGGGLNVRIQGEDLTKLTEIANQVEEIIGNTPGAVDPNNSAQLRDPEVRFGMKNFSNWPTFPQLFVKGELVGGCDIVSSLFESGELQALLKSKGVLQ